MEQKTAEHGYLYAVFSLKTYFKSKSHSMIKAHVQEISLEQKKSVNTVILLFRN